MTENDLRTAMHATMTASPPPPPMESAPALTAARRAVRRRTTLAAAGVTAGLVAVTSLAISVGLPRQGTPLVVAGQPSASPPVVARQPSANPDPPSVADTKPVWPTDGNGVPQEDATQQSGPRYEKGKTALASLLAVVPAGYTTPAGSLPDGTALQDHQAAVETGTSWSYQASAAVAKGGGTGRLLVEVHTVGNGLSSDPCTLAQQFWGMKGQCQVVTVGAAKVGVVVKPGSDDRLDQWAAYRYPDGIVVFVAQSRNATSTPDAATTPLSTLPLSVPKLAALAVDQRFHLS